MCEVAAAAAAVVAVTGSPVGELQLIRNEAVGQSRCCS